MNRLFAVGGLGLAVALFLGANSFPDRAAAAARSGKLFAPRNRATASPNPPTAKSRFMEDRVMVKSPLSYQGSFS